MTSEPLSNERGAVMVIVALALFAMTAMLAFAIDVPHWFDYSRNLQNRADAAALAAGLQYGDLCSGNPTDPTASPENSVGEMAQLFSGPPGSNSDLPYTYSGTGSPLDTAGPLASYWTAQPSVTPAYQNIPNLSVSNGTNGANYHVLLNADNYKTSGGTNFAMGDFCNGNPTLDKTDKECYGQTNLQGQLATDCATGAMVDVKVTQADLPQFVPIFGFRPNISAHARVALESVAGANGITPIAVRSSNVECVEANFVNAATDAVITGPITLTKAGQDASNGATIWEIPNGTSFTMPPSANVYVQVVVNDCNNNTLTNYDTTSGLLYINNYPTATTAATVPTIVNGGVVLTNSCTPDQYFSTSDCSVGVTAHVAFPSGATNPTVTAVDQKTGNSVTLSNTLANPTTWTSNSSLTIAAETGQHPIEITWTDASGNGTFNVQQQAFSACDGTILPTTCADPNDSGPIQLAQLSTCSGTPLTCPGGSGANAFASNSTHTLELVVETGTLANGKAGQPPTILRFSESGAGQTYTSHATGLLNCGQGSGNAGSIQAIFYGCPTAGSTLCPALSTNSNFDFCAPLAINARNDVCTPAGNQLGSSFVARTTSDPTVPVDCFQTVGGTKSPIPQGIACRIIQGTSINNGCQLPPGSTNVCSSNNWSTTDAGEYIGSVGDDPRAMVMVISAPEDLNKNNEIVPIHNFGIFYVTGWDTKGSMSKYNCDSYTTAPNTSVENSNDTVANPQQGEVWGYWIKDTIPNAIPSGELCNPATFGACTPALTR